jgi:hypothetical protein
MKRADRVVVVSAIYCHTSLCCYFNSDLLSAHLGNYHTFKPEAMLSVLPTHRQIGAFGISPPKT